MTAATVSPRGLPRASARLLRMVNAGDFGMTGPAPGSAAFAAYQRFAALSAAARHAWLAHYLPALRAGHITVRELP